MIYLITFACYGCHLHGSEAGSVDRHHNDPGAPILEPNAALTAASRERMVQAPYALDAIRRNAVLEAIREVCKHRSWTLLAAHVRSTHAHMVVEADAPPERVLNDFRTYSSRRLNQMRLDAPRRNRWARHGSTRWLWLPKHISAAIEYVVREQGEAMSVYESEEA